MRLRDHERNCAHRLKEAGVESPGLCARMLVSHAAGMNGLDYILSCDFELAPAAEKKLYDLLSRRESGEPMAFILGKKEFYSRNFRVSSATLIPRPETETLVDNALCLFPADAINFADLGCGSGCIGLTLMAERPSWKGILIDNSPEALEVASVNAVAIAPEASLILADIFDLPLANESLELIISNPPYINPAEKADVMPDVLAFEPHSALFSPCGGLAHLEAVIAAAAGALRTGGYVVMEHGATQANAVKNLFRKYGFFHQQNLKDLAGLPRCAIGMKT